MSSLPTNVVWKLRLANATGLTLRTLHR
jgi:hypothetical protein